MSKEGNSYQNPIRFYSDSGVLLWEKGKKAFDSQVPGKYADDPINGNTYVCTSYKTLNNEPVWALINAGTLKPTTTYKVLVNMGKSGNEPSSISASGKTVKYSSAVVTKRLNKGNNYSVKNWGSFIFIGITDSDYKFIQGEPVTSAESTTTVASTGADSKLVSVLTKSFREIDEMYNHLYEQSNGRSGASTVNRTDANGNSGFGAALTPAQINRTDANGNSGFGASSRKFTSTREAEEALGFGVSSVTPSGSSNPSSSSGNKNSNGRALARERQNPSYGQSTAVVNFLPDRRIGGQNTNLPYIQQTITDFNSVTNTRERIIRTHVFDIIPNSFEFSQLSSVWNEVERSGNYAMVDWSKYNLTKCTFRFLVAGKRTDTTNAGTATAKSVVVNDGLDISIDEQIEILRAMGGAPYPVVLHNLNTLTATSFRFPYVNNTRNLQWVIADMSITATRMTPNGRKMAAAEVSITLNEYPIIARDIIALPPLAPDNPVPKICKPKPCKPVDPKNNLLSTGFTIERDTSGLALPEKTPTEG
jgi:hypothetical protein